MGISIQTNVNSLVAQENLRVNSDFQGRTIQRLTSGYRINQSGDDAAGLAIANKFRSDVTELQQGVRNANDGLSHLQIIDGGLNNISKALDRLKTLATQSASTTFTGDRRTLNNEFQSLTKEIDRQAANIGLNSGGRFNSNIGVYIGGAKGQADAQVNVDLSGTRSAVDSQSLGLGGTNVLSGGVGFGTSNRLDAPDGAYLVGTAGTDDQTFTFNIQQNGASQTVTATIEASAGGSSVDTVLSTLNGKLNDYGVTAALDANGELQFSGGVAFTASVTASAGGTNALTTGADTLTNTSNFAIAGQATYAAGAQTLTFETSSGKKTVSLDATDDVDGAISKINAQTGSAGVFAVKNAAGTGISLQGSQSFSVQASAAGTFAAAGTSFATDPTNGTASNATAAIAKINQAGENLGLVQGTVGTGQNRLQSAISLAQSQIANFSAAESRIRDADVASEAANLTKAQVLSQASLAAMSQANSAPQAVLSLLRG